MKDITIPGRLASRPKDRRGYPIPWIVTIDPDGVPHFTINDYDKHFRAVTEKRCALCGHKLNGNTWLVGGPGAAFHKMGGYIDPPVHKDCGTYALKVCPFLALTYAKRIEDKTLRGRDDVLVAVETRVNPAQPEVFVFIKTAGITPVDAGGGSVVLQPKRPLLAVEFWRHGERISATEARPLIASDPNRSCDIEDLAHWWRDE